MKNRNKKNGLKCITPNWQLWPFEPDEVVILWEVCLGDQWQRKTWPVFFFHIQFNLSRHIGQKDAIAWSVLFKTAECNQLCEMWAEFFNLVKRCLGLWWSLEKKLICRLTPKKVNNGIFYLTGMFAVAVVLDMSPTEPAEMRTQSASDVWSWSPSTDPRQMWSSADHRGASIACTFTKNVWETRFTVVNTYCVEVQYYLPLCMYCRPMTL